MKRLLILHGWSSCSERWQKVRELLEKEGIEVLVPDLPGFGNEPPPKEIWGVEEYKNWVLKFLNEKRWEKFNILGHSFGGAVSALIAASYPEKIEKLILSGSSIIRKESWKVKIFKKISGSGKKILLKTGLKNLELFQRFLAKISGSYDYYNAKGIMKEIFKKVISQNLEPILGKIKNPTLILWGENDKIVPLKNAFLMERTIKNSKLITFRAVSHSPYLEIPETMAKEIVNFLNF